MSISLALDIATSVSVITAAYFYIKDAKRAREENSEKIERSRFEKKQEFAISRMQKITDAIGYHRLEFEPIHSGFSASDGREKTAFFNLYIKLLCKFKMQLLVIKDSDFVIYANNDEKNSIEEITNYIDETIEYTKKVGQKIKDNTVTNDDTNKLINFIDKYDEQLSNLTIKYAELLKNRLSY